MRDTSGIRLETHGYQAKYSDEEIRAMAEKGELDDRFIVRFIEADYSTPDSRLGPANPDGSIRYWSTTFNQMENADTDPRTNCGILGITYDPTKTYYLIIVDTAAQGSGLTTSFVPTYKKLGEFASKEVDGLDPAIVESVMTAEYSERYAEEMAAFTARGNDISREAQIERYASERFSSSEEREQFKTRTQIHRQLGANDHYTGNGTTKNLLPGGQQCGVMETFTYDKHPKTLGELRDAVKIIKAEPFLSQNTSG